MPITPYGLACVTVTFNPDLEVLHQQLAGLPREALKIIVDNASSLVNEQALAACVAAFDHVQILRNAENRGLPAALNQGVQATALTPRITHVLLLDQDSEPAPGSVQRLLDAFEQLSGAGRPMGCVGPRLIDVQTGLQHGFHRQQGWRWTRRFPAAEDREPLPCTNLNGSGTLMKIEFFERLGGLEEGMFIDHVDTEWAFRVLGSGHELWGIPDASFRHQMGLSSVRFWCFGWRVWPSRSPARHYFLYRNTLRLWRRPYVSRVWKFWSAVKLLLTCMVHLLAGPQRLAHVSQMARGLHDGLVERPDSARHLK